MSGRTGLYSSFPAVFTVETAVETLALRSIENQSMTPNAAITQRRWGNVDLLARGLANADPRIRFTTPDLDALFGGSFSIRNGLCVQDGAVVCFRERDDCGTFRASAEHPVYNCPGRGFLFLDRLTVDEESESPAQFNLEYAPLFDSADTSGTYLVENRLVRKEYLQSLHSYPPQFNSWYWMGPVYWSGDKKLENVIGWEYSTGIRFRVRRDNSEYYGGSLFGDRGVIAEREETVRIRTKKIDNSKTRYSTGASDWVSDTIAEKMTNLFLSALGSATAALDLYLIKGVSPGSRYDPATTNHARIRWDIANASEDDISVAGEDDATLTIEIKNMGTPAISTGIAVAAATGDADS